MTTPIQRFKPTNERLYDMIRQTCYGMVEESEQVQKLYASHNQNLEKITGKVSDEIYGDINDLVFQVASFIGESMFDLGITIARNPAAIFDLPDTTGPFSF